MALRFDRAHNGLSAPLITPAMVIIHYNSQSSLLEIDSPLSDLGRLPRRDGDEGPGHRDGGVELLDIREAADWGHHGQPRPHRDRPAPPPRRGDHLQLQLPALGHLALCRHLSRVSD